jgi:GNAT superfamily N-acetyltransferase
MTRYPSRVIIRLVPMTETAYERWFERGIRDYAQDHVEAGDWPADEALERSRRQFAELLPQGRETAGHQLWTIEDDEGRDVGMLWVAPHPTWPGAVWIYDFVVEPEARGRGIGRAALEALDGWAHERGVTRIGLHVFGSNDVAPRLYQRAGFVETDVTMVKRL